MKKFVFLIVLAVLIICPVKGLAAGKIIPPNLVEVRIDDQFVDKSKVAISQDQPLQLIGTAKPSSSVYLYFFSDEPRVAQVAVDEGGNWQYILSQAFKTGTHKVEAETHVGNQISSKIEILKFKVVQPTVSLAEYLIIIFSLVVLTLFVYVLNRRKKKSTA